MTMDSKGLEDGVTRRQFLIGGGVALGALAVAGVVAQRTLPLRTYWYQLTGQCGPDGPVPEELAKPAYGTFRSEVLGADVEYGHWAPAVRDLAGFKYPVCYCLPARGQSPHWVLDAPVYLADFAAVKNPDGGIPVLALVSIDGSDTYWHERADGEDRMTMLLDEFIPWYEREHDVGGSRENRAVMGWSMGGYGALLAADARTTTASVTLSTTPGTSPRTTPSPASTSSPTRPCASTAARPTCSTTRRATSPPAARSRPGGRSRATPCTTPRAR